MRGGAGFSPPPGSRLLMTWSGVRGGISVALTLSLLPGPDHNLILMLTYMVAAFFTLVAGTNCGAARPEHAREHMKETLKVK